MIGDGPIDLGRRGVGQGDRRRVRFDEKVDLVDVEGVAVFAEADRAREVLADLDDEQPIGIGARQVQFLDARARVQRQRAPAVGVGRARSRRHHAGCELAEQRAEATEVGRAEADVRPRVAQGPVERAEEPRQVVDVPMVEQVGEHGEQRAVDVELLPVVPVPHLGEQVDGLAGPEGHPERVGGSDPGRGFGRGETFHDLADRRRPRRARWACERGS